MDIALTHTQLGSDPEAPGLRFGALMRSSVPRGAPKRCPLEAALGVNAPCEGEDCPFYRVRGVAPACAVEAWSPSAAKRRDVAQWYRRRREISRGPRSPERRRSHGRETPGEAHARRERACAEAHARTAAALRDLDLAIHRSERWCDGLALDLGRADARAQQLRLGLRRAGHIH